MRKFIVVCVCACCFLLKTKGQTDTAVAEEDFSMYENFDFADEGAKRYCTPKVFDLSPAKLISIGYDYQGPFSIAYGPLVKPDSGWAASNSNYNQASGIRFSANIPVISKTHLVWQLGFNYAGTAFHGDQDEKRNAVDSTLVNHGLTTTGLNTTLFKPFNAEHFLIVQASADVNGDYRITNALPTQFTRYSAAVIFGKKINDRKMMGFGISRTYRVGEINYIPVMLLNWTAPSRKWGVEMLAPARVHVRKTISARNILLFGYELEGNSYHILNATNDKFNNYELRRSELRFRAIWETSIHSFLWMSIQAGYRYGYSFNLDRFDNNKEFFRGFFGDQSYAQENVLGGTWYAQFTLNLVSP